MTAEGNDNLVCGMEIMARGAEAGSQETTSEISLQPAVIHISEQGMDWLTACELNIQNHREASRGPEMIEAVTKESVTQPRKTHL